jgi:HK97 family phage portal protein
MKASFYAAVASWVGSTYDFSSWFGRKFWGVDNSSLSTNELIFTAITKKSNVLASLPLKLYENYDVVNSDVADLLLNSPNKNMSGFDFIRILEVCRNSTGNGYALIMPNIRGLPDQLVPLDPDYVEEVFDTESNELWYKVQGQKEAYYFHNLSIIHVKHVHGANTWRGISPIKVLENTLKFDKAVKEFSISEMEQAPNSFILKYGANVDKEKRQDVVENFRSFYAENGGVLFSEPGVEIEKLERKFVSADIAASETISAKRIANVIGVPVHWLGAADGQSYSSLEHLMREYVVVTLTPDVTQYEQEFNRKLLLSDARKEGQYWKFNLKSLLRGDTAAQTNFYNSGIRNGYLSQDDVRRYEDLPPAGGAAANLWVSGDLYPINMDPSKRKGGDSTGKSAEKTE